jgi:hypothetical protein
MRQTRKLEGSFTNYLMGNNSSTPEVGKGATLLSYSDRYPAEVLDVSADGKQCVIREMEHKAKPNSGGMGHQDWELTPNPNGYKRTLIYRNGAWRDVIENVVFEPQFERQFESSGLLWRRAEELGLYDEQGHLKLVKGFTKVVRAYPKVNILFGRAEYHYDWEF